MKMGGLWSHTDKNQKKYLTGYMGDLKIMIFENQYFEEGTNKPTHIMYLGEKKKDETNAQYSKPTTSATAAGAIPGTEDDLPF